MTRQGQRPDLTEIREHIAGLDIELAGLLPGGLPAIGQEAPALLAGLPVLVLPAGLPGVLDPALLSGGAALPDHLCSLEDVQHAGGEGLSALLAIHVVSVILAQPYLPGEVVGVVRGEPVDPGLPSHSRPVCSPTRMEAAQSDLSLAFFSSVLASLRKAAAVLLS